MLWSLVLVEVLSAWNKVREPGNPLTRAFQQACARPIKLVAPANLGTKFEQLVSTAYHLQVACGDNPIALPVTPLAQLFDSHPRRVSSMLEMAKQLGILQDEDSEYSFTKGRAKTYSFNLFSPLYSPP